MRKNSIVIATLSIVWVLLSLTACGPFFNDPNDRNQWKDMPSKKNKSDTNIFDDKETPLQATPINNFPQTDFYLYEGKREYQEYTLTAKGVEETLFKSVDVDVKEGKIITNNSIPFKFKDNANDIFGTASLIMNGDYDKTKGQLLGTFIISTDTKSVWHGAVKDINSDWVDTISGTFLGQVVDDKVEMQYTGRFAITGHLGKALGTVEEIARAEDYSASVVWSLMREEKS